MKFTVITPYVEILTPLDGIIEHLERAGRVCYKSEERIGPGTAEKFVRQLRQSGHESVLEHATISALFVGDRSMSHQLVRHRIAAYSQESMRFCNYGKKDFQFVCPPSVGVQKGEYEFDDSVYPPAIKLQSCLPFKQYRWILGRALDCVEYLDALEDHILPEDARSCLPQATKTEVVATYNLRMWRHVFNERALNERAQWQIRELMQKCLELFANKLPCIFEDQMEKLNEFRSKEAVSKKSISSSN
jgi:thymidylate synthase (FAD)